MYEQDPFAKLDQVGVGQLVKMAAEKGRATRPNIKLGICGEHGGDPSLSLIHILLRNKRLIWIVRLILI